MGAPTASEQRMVVWDAPTRLCKWALVVLVLLAWVSREYGDVTLRWHMLNGYGILTLVVFRLLWGVAGSGSARLGHLFQSPRAGLDQATQLIARRHRHWMGHTPLGGWMAAALLLLLLLQGLSGLFTADSNGIFGGPFAHTDFMSEPDRIQRQLSWLHHHVFDGLLILIAVHAAVGLFHQFVLKDGLIGAMITGRKPARPFQDADQISLAPASWRRAVACLLTAAAVVAGGVTAGGGGLP